MVFIHSAPSTAQYRRRERASLLPSILKRRYGHSDDFILKDTIKRVVYMHRTQKNVVNFLKESNKMNGPIENIGSYRANINLIVNW